MNSAAMEFNFSGGGLAWINLTRIDISRSYLIRCPLSFYRFYSCFPLLNVLVMLILLSQKLGYVLLIELCFIILLKLFF